ncbi:hypothetical protein, partial [Frankia sp. CIT1]|uniref:hypothetical protein n=1 Tax=Frankia sp. CIT1 TaxID=2880974 RepID=UPI001EF61C04
PGMPPGSNICSCRVRTSARSAHAISPFPPLAETGIGIRMAMLGPVAELRRMERNWRDFMEYLLIPIASGWTVSCLGGRSAELN